VVAFGHVGDGNIHYNCSKSERGAAEDFFRNSAEVNRIVYDVVHGLRGSISAEHGLGQLKVDEIAHYKDPLELGTHEEHQENARSPRDHEPREGAAMTGKAISPEDQVFFDLVTRFINEANRMNDEQHHRSRVSAALLFAAARYNAFTWMHREKENGPASPRRKPRSSSPTTTTMFRENVEF
jgi:hypothetical protein